MLFRSIYIYNRLQCFLDRGLELKEAYFETLKTTGVAVALSGETLHGVVDSLSPGTGSQFALLPAQNATGNFTKIVQRVPVRIHVDVPNDARPVLVPGLSVVVDVDTRDLHPASAPASAAAHGASHG